MDDEELGMVSPEEFIKVAEKTGQINFIGEIVFEKVCQFLKEQTPQKYGMEYVEVNLSTVECMNPLVPSTIRSLMNKYGIDKPELRVNNMEFIELTDWAKKSEFSIFQESECIKAIVLPKALGRSEVEKKYEAYIKSYGSKALPWLSFTEEGVKGSVSKFFDENAITELRKIANIE
jgi:aspartyl-tRNA synthetase